jgi:hypothetical protein
MVELLLLLEQVQIVLFIMKMVRVNEPEGNKKNLRSLFFSLIIYCLDGVIY